MIRAWAIEASPRRIKSSAKKRDAIGGPPWLGEVIHPFDLRKVESLLIFKTWSTYTFLSTGS